LTFCRDAAVVHAHPHTLGSFLRQQFRYGRGSFVYRRRRRQRLGRSAFFASPSFYAGLVWYPLRVRGWTGWPHAARLALAQVTTASGALVEWLRGAALLEPFSLVRSVVHARTRQDLGKNPCRRSTSK
jgi:cellulose synthase/poly-beta-1,6-N-acetylglucosamine synthase-like glycosyltransferase